VGALASPSSTGRVCLNTEGHSWLGVQVLGTILAGRAQVGWNQPSGRTVRSGRHPRPEAEPFGGLYRR